MYKKSDAPLLVELNESLRTLFNELCFVENNQVVFRDESWIDVIDLKIKDLAHLIMTKIIDQYNPSPSVLLTTLREKWIPSIMPDLELSGIKNVIIDIAKLFIWNAESGLAYGLNIVDIAIGSDVLSDDDFKYAAQRADYSKKLAEFSRAFVEDEDVKDSSWNKHYAAWHLSYASFCADHAYKHLHFSTDSQPVIMEAAFAAEYAADVASNVADAEKLDVRDQLKNVRDIAGRIGILAIGLGSSTNE